ncbi:peptidyl-tRNA hydrolase [Cryobacterium arcticum]|uniref:peptidyl-tRNA hydrolase n=1 Tax=Cryobacterium arcticum TaxID=670052 RepID=A0A1B1BKU8_9MICO|nr:peptidyl-tRNA hydrolase [Cryobacterium arcticum]ANP73033.1 hypothetical protein PA27867_2081 [Cryobacterium arcticum]
MNEFTADPVQTIVVKPSTHFDTITAAAFASGLSLAQADLDSEPWRTWLAGSFTKSVRQAKRPADLERLRTLDLPRIEIAVGDAVNIAFVPAPYDQSPREISRLQVSGLDLEREATAGGNYARAGAVTPHIEINREAAMSTGKTAAQVSHAVCAWLLAQPLGTRRAWAQRPGISLSEISFVEQDDEVETQASLSTSERRLIVIRDNGLTEVTPGTTTVRVFAERFA